VAALGSYADARNACGRWHVRIEDLDHARVLPGCADRLLATLESFGFAWDGPVQYQSRRTEHYAQALALLRARGLIFECSCSRRELEGGSGYPGTCRAGPARPGPTAQRFRMGEGALLFTDRFQGRITFERAERGDVIVARRDGAFAYQLAVVVDDALQKFTDVVRGADLLDSTPWQIALQQALGYSSPRYAHLPLILERNGQKLAKSRRSLPLDATLAGRQLHGAATLLGQAPPAQLKFESAACVLDWVCRNWTPERVYGVREITVAD
jgi:glutamyl-Q tRNA(Asp) synthetase